jgi:hypothetical protein
MERRSDNAAGRGGTIADSPWLWLLAFCLFGLLAMQLLAGKYGQRQAQIERQYQGRRWAQIEAQAPADEPPPQVEFSTTDNPLIGLGPPQALLLLIGTGALLALIRERRGRGEARRGT